MRSFRLSLLLFFTLGYTILPAQQIDLNRVELMPDLPSNYSMRDWKDVARKYDSLVFNLGLVGEHLPIISLGSEGVNYPEIKPIFMDSYVGSSAHGQQREAINIIPALVGATLVGADKTTQFGIDWVSKIRDFYNLKNGELVYLNGPSDKSGHDWWYETMPNIFFYQLNALYPNTAGFETHFISVADRWLAAVEAMGADDTPWTEPLMNYRAWSLKEMAPLETGVKEPEAAGAIAWILYQAYQQTSDKKYLVGSQWALDFLHSQTANPSYELQLPYGVLTAAKLNAEHGSHYDLVKLLNWCFDRGDLRGWGSVAGTWGGEDVSGLIGEANDQGNDYAFLMNGFQQATALAPLVKYDKRFAGSIAKWILNMANASRLFYADFLPENQQSDYAWSQTNDPHSVIAYEAIKEQWDGISLYARGDSKAAGWADTNLGLYGSSHVGYLGALIEETDVAGILRIDVNITDFYAANNFPTYLYYNPHAVEKSVTLQVGEMTKDLYDAISEETIQTNVNGAQILTIPPDSVRLISLVPAGGTWSEKESKLYHGASVVDHRYGYDFDPKLRIKHLTAETDQLELETTSSIYCTIDGAEEVTFQWYVNGQPEANAFSGVLEYTPAALGEVLIKVVATAANQSVSDSVALEVVEMIPLPPVIHSIAADSRWYRPGATFAVSASVTDPKGLDLMYDWAVENGVLIQTDGAAATLQSENTGVLTVTLTASNSSKTSVSSHDLLIVAEQSASEPLLQLSMNGTFEDQSANHFTTHLNGGTFVAGPVPDALEALRLSSASHELLVSNNNTLNFRDEVGISLWVRFTNFSEERFLISHGSWEKRWKLSTTMEKKLRWTINTTEGIKDLDGNEEMEVDRWYHIAAVYDGSSMQLYIQGELNSFLKHSGQINVSDVGISIGKRLAGDAQYDLKGTVDELRLYHQSIDVEEVPVLLNEWSPKVISGIEREQMAIYPNPASGFVTIKYTGTEALSIYDLSGVVIKAIPVHQGSTVDISDLPVGIYLVKSQDGYFIQKLMIR